MMNTKSDPFWMNHPEILIDPRRIAEFVPYKSMTKIEQLNASVRFCIYASILLALFKMDFNYLLIFVAGLAITAAIYHFDPNHMKNEEKREMFEDISQRVSSKKYVEPTYDNPFMNPCLTDYTDNPNREAASKRSFVKNEELKNDIEDKFTYNLYQDVNDIYGKNNGQRQFYTTPVTTIPNDQDSFAKWLYGKPTACKDVFTNTGGSGYQCNLNNHRFLEGESRDIMY